MERLGLVSPSCRQPCSLPSLPGRREACRPSPARLRRHSVGNLHELCRARHQNFFSRRLAIVLRSSNKDITELQRAAGLTSSQLEKSEGSQGDREPDNDEEDPPGYGLMDWEAFSTSWEAPWGFGTVAFGMALWLVGFVTTGVVLVPYLGQVLGFISETSSLAQMDQVSKAQFTLVNQVVETAVGIGSIYLVTAKFDLPEDMFRLSLKNPLRKPDGWLVWAIWGILLAPLFVGLASTAVESFGYDESGRGTVDEVVKIVDLEGSTYLSLLTVTGFLAPLLEETVFRGFLLTSLTKWLPTPLAVLVSAGAFGLCHLSPKDLPQLISLGTVLGFSYVRSRNLLTPMIIHGAWNSTVITVLYVLASNGVDLNDVISGKYDMTLPFWTS